MSYKPLPDCLTIKESSIEGLGVFAKENIYAGNTYNLLGQTHVIENESLYRVNYGGFINHSFNANCKLFKVAKEENYESYSIYPIRDIKAGEEITLDYTKELCGLESYKDEDWLK